MERYDAAVIGAGPEGLVAAQRLAVAGLRVVVLEKQDIAGGRAVTREFHPGFRASPFCDLLPPVPDRLYWSLELTRRGALFAEPATAMLVSGKRALVRGGDVRNVSRKSLDMLDRGIAATRAAIAEHGLTPPERPSRFAKPRAETWPGEDWTRASLDSELAPFGDNEAQLLETAHALSGRAGSPFITGTALHLVSAAGVVVKGGLGTLGAALEAAAKEAGAEIRLGREVNGIKREKTSFFARRVLKVELAGGEVIETRAVLSSLDVKRTFLGLFSWSDLPAALVKRVGQYRMNGQCARVLFALDAPPVFLNDFEASRGPVHVVESLETLSRSYDSWRSGILADQLPVTLRVPSLADFSLAPPGKAVMTATIGAVPSKLFDGAWTKERSGLLAAMALAAAEKAAPGCGTKVLTHTVITAPDIEAALGATEGDLEGGDLSPDQALGFRPFPDWGMPRTPVPGVYLAGSSAPAAAFFTGLSGARAAQAVIADLGK